MIRRIFLSLLLFLLTVSKVWATDLQIREGLYRLSFDSLTLPGNETLGLLGTNYLLNFDNSYLGLGVYSAVNGQRGGFFTGGIELGHRFGLTSDYYLDGGLFVGGGGGGGAPQGGGLMVRPHLTLMKRIGQAAIGLGVSKVSFPNGDINSSQVNLQLDTPFGFVYKNMDSFKTDNNDVQTLERKSSTTVGWRDNYIASTYQHYFIDSGVKEKDGSLMTKDMDLMGFEYGVGLGGNYYAYLETAGAGGGETDGYAELLGGLGYKKTLGSNYGFNIKTALGSSGGGGVDTGGGLIHKQSIGLYAKPFENLLLTAELGRIGAFDGGFRATTSKLSVQYPFQLLSTGGTVRKSRNYNYNNNGLWSIGAVNQTYLGSNTLRKNGSDESVQLLGVKLNRYLDDDTYLTGQALAAYQGKAGGYAVGLIGIGQEFSVTDKLNFSAEMNIGVAGGGGIATGGGGVIQPTFGLTYKLNPDVNLRASVGKLKAINNGGDTKLLEIGLSYRFKTVE